MVLKHKRLRLLVIYYTLIRHIFILQLLVLLKKVSVNVNLIMLVEI